MQELRRQLMKTRDCRRDIKYLKDDDSSDSDTEWIDDAIPLINAESFGTNY